LAPRISRTIIMITALCSVMNSSSAESAPAALVEKMR